MLIHGSPCELEVRTVLADQQQEIDLLSKDLDLCQYNRRADARIIKTMLERGPDTAEAHPEPLVDLSLGWWVVPIAAVVAAGGAAVLTCALATQCP